MREAQRALVEAEKKVTPCQHQWFEAEEERQQLCHKAAKAEDKEDTGPSKHLENLSALASTMDDDEEVLEALEVVRRKIGQRQAASASAPHEAPVPHNMDVEELERQTAAAKRHAQETEERLISAKKARTEGSSFCA